MRYGVTGRRKRNMRRVGELQALRERRRTHRGAPAMPRSPPDRRRRPARWSSRPKASARATAAVPIVRDFSIRIQRGDRIGIVGPNGSGKTTLINLLTGTLPPDAGSVRLGSNLAIATLDQHRDSLDPDVTVAEALTGGAATP